MTRTMENILPLTGQNFSDFVEEIKEAGIPINVLRCFVNEEGMVFDSKIPIK